MKPKICLNMIVKNEAHVMQRCLTSLRGFIDCWVIVDTGSTDGTQVVIRDYMHDIPGELHERPWKNFGHNRSEALALARDKADYVFVIDADEVLSLPTEFQRPALTADAYSLLLSYGEMSYWRMALVATRLDWRYVGVLHEYLDCAQPHVIERLEGPRVIVNPDGGRSRGDPIEKFAADARVLEQGLIDEPDNARYVFYLAQSYRDSNQLEKSLHAYQRRAALGGWEEEVWYSLYQVAGLSERLALDETIVVQRYLHAWQARPQRAEPLAQLARYYREHGARYALAHLFAQCGIGIVKPDDALFVDESVYAWRCLDEYAIASYWIGHYAESARVCRLLLDGGALPVAERERVRGNLDFALGKLEKP